MTARRCWALAVGMCIYIYGPFAAHTNKRTGLFVRGSCFCFFVFFCFLFFPAPFLALTYTSSSSSSRCRCAAEVESGTHEGLQPQSLLLVSTSLRKRPSGSGTPSLPCNTVETIYLFFFFKGGGGLQRRSLSLFSFLSLFLFLTTERNEKRKKTTTNSPSTVRASIRSRIKSTSRLRCV